MKLLAISLGLAGVTALAATMPMPGSISTSGQSTLIGTGHGTVAVTPITPDIFKVSRIPYGEKKFSFPRSQASVLSPSSEGVTWFASPTEVTFRSASTIVKVNRLTGRTIFLNAEGDTILSEAGGVDNSGDLKRVSLRNGIAQNLYGGGERGHSLRLNGDTLVMFNRQNYGYVAGDPRISQMGITVPWFVSDAGYGVLFDDYNRASLSLGKDSIVYESETPKPLSYYFVNGEGSLAGATSRYTELTGRQQLPPFWALAITTSRRPSARSIRSNSVIIPSTESCSTSTGMARRPTWDALNGTKTSSPTIAACLTPSTAWECIPSSSTSLISTRSVR